MEPVSIGGPARRLLAGCLLRTQPDEKLIAFYREGHEGAFEEIDRRYRSRLTAYAGSFVGADRAEDVLQESFARAAKALRADEREIQLGPWLYRIVRNGSLNALRDAPPAHALLDESIDGVEQPPDAVLRREELQETVAAVRGLPDSQREALVRREVEGESLADIGSSMGVSSGAVGLLIFRARTALRDGCGFLVPVGLLRLVLGGAGGTGIATGGAGAVTLGKGVTAIAIGAGALGGGIAIERAVETAPPPAVAAPIVPGTAEVAAAAEPEPTGSGESASGAGSATSARDSGAPSREVGQAQTENVSSTGSVAGTGAGEATSGALDPAEPQGTESPTRPPPPSGVDDGGYAGDHHHQRHPDDGGYHHMDGGGGGGFHHDGPGDDGGQAPPPPSGSGDYQPPSGSGGTYDSTEQQPPPPAGTTFPQRSPGGMTDRLERDAEPVFGSGP